MLASEFKKGIGSISDTTLGGSAANVDVTGIVSSYAHLLIVAYLRSDLAGPSGGVILRFNGDTAANYDYQTLIGNATSHPASESFAVTNMSIGIMPAASAGANLFGACVIFIPNYAGSSNKLALSMTGAKYGTTTGLMEASVQGGFWRSTAAITRLTLLPAAAGNLVAGTRVTVYGMGA